MSNNDDEGPVYYREIQKNGFLKRLPSETGGSKLLPLGYKKPSPKPMWTLFCVHNGRTPYLEQYPAPESRSALAHKPVWRASLQAARHVTASVKPHVGSEHDFLIHTESGGVRMLAPDWDSMHAWVRCLRHKLLELRILPPAENVYCAPAAPAPPAPPRAASRDPTSPLPPTPSAPADRVPGIEQNTPRQTTIPEMTEQETTTDPTTPPAIDSQSRPTMDNPQSRAVDNAQSRIAIDNPSGDIDISDWDSTLNLSSLPSTSQEKAKCDPQKSVAKICGQNICLDDSIFKRSEATESDEEFCNEILDSAESRSIDSGEPSIDCQSESIESPDVVEDYTQRLVVNSGGKVSETCDGGTDDSHNSVPPSNVTVIVVSNKPTADSDSSDVTRVTTTDNGYGAVFSTPEPEYGHISLTTTVNLTQDGVYERLCMASTSTIPSPLPVRKLTTTDKIRKSSLPNLTEPSNSNNSTYEYLFSDNNETSINISNSFCKNSVSLDSNSTTNVNSDPNSTTNVNSNPSSMTNINSNPHSGSNINSDPSSTTNINSNPSNTININSNQNSRTNFNSNLNSKPNVNSNPNSTTNVNSNYTTNINSNLNSRTNINSKPSSTTNINSKPSSTINVSSKPSSTTNANSNRIHANSNQNSHSNLVVNRNGLEHVNSVCVGANDASIASEGRGVERSHSQSACDSTLRERLIRREGSPKRERDKPEPAPQSKPIWRRTLTELALLSRLRGIAHAKRTESAVTRHDATDRDVSGVVVHRSRAESRADSGRRRSTSLSNGTPAGPHPAGQLPTLRLREAAWLLAEQSLSARVCAARPPLLFAHDAQLWVACWWRGARHGGRAGDRVLCVRGAAPRDLQHARQLARQHPHHKIDIVYNRVPLAKIYVLNKKTEDESIGITLDGECAISGVTVDSPCARAGAPPPGHWAVTEVNNRPLNLVKGAQADMARLSACGKEVSILLQPAPLVRKLRQALKQNKSLLALR